MAKTVSTNQKGRQTNRPKLFFNHYIMSIYCTFCTQFPQNIRPFLPLRLLFDILIVKHYCQKTDCITTFQHVLQILLAKLMISPDIKFILHVFLAECVCFLTYLDEQVSHLAIFLFLSEEKQTNSGGVSLGLSLDFLIYIIK